MDSSNSFTFKIYGSNDVGFVKVMLAEHHHFHTIVQVYKILHQLVPVYLQDMFTCSEEVTGYVGRNSHRLFIPRCGLLMDKRVLFYRGTVAWSNIDQILYSANSLSTFKSMYELLYS